MKPILTKFYCFLVAGSMLLAACSDDDVNPNETGNDKYVILTTTEKFGAGYMTSFDGFPEGEVAKLNDNSLQITNAFGFRSFGKWIFIGNNAAGENGIQKYSVNADGSLKDEGFIATGLKQYHVVDETHGYYLDGNRSTINLQTFNPSTMERTGEVDLSSLEKATVDGKDVEFQTVGQHILASKEGKLYAGITYGTLARTGYGDDIVDYVEFAVIDMATNTLEKTIKYEDMAPLGWGSSGNKMWTLGDDGALYFCSPGLAKGMATSSIVRIKAGETDFDKDWIVKAVDYNGPTSLATARVKNGKLYIELASEDIVDFAGLELIVYDYYAIDLETLEATKITGMPQHHYVWANEQAITEIDGKLYFWVKNPDEGIDAYYVLNSDGISATQVFNVDQDGYMWGFVKLD